MLMGMGAIGDTARPVEGLGPTAASAASDEFPLRAARRSPAMPHSVAARLYADARALGPAAPNRSGVHVIVGAARAGPDSLGPDGRLVLVLAGAAKPLPSLAPSRPARLFGGGLFASRELRDRVQPPSIEKIAVQVARRPEAFAINGALVPVTSTSTRTGPARRGRR